MFVNVTCPGKSWKKGFWSPGKPWNLVFASPRKKAFLCLYEPWLANDHAFVKYGTIPKAYRGRLLFVSCDFEVGRNVTCEESTVSPIRG